MVQCADTLAFVICLESKSETRCDANMDSIQSVFPLAPFVAPSLEYIELLYGPDWRIPKKNFKPWDNA